MLLLRQKWKFIPNNVDYFVSRINVFSVVKKIIKSEKYQLILTKYMLFSFPGTPLARSSNGVGVASFFLW